MDSDLSIGIIIFNNNAADEGDAFYCFLASVLSMGILDNIYLSLTQYYGGAEK